MVVKLLLPTKAFEFHLLQVCNDSSCEELTVVIVSFPVSHATHYAWLIGSS